MSEVKTNMIQSKSSTSQEIILGLGKFSIDDIEILLTRGGGTFTVEREYREIEADGMKAAGKDMITIDREQPKLTMNILSILTKADLTKLYPALKSEEVSREQGVKITSNDDLVIQETDYHKVTWTGVTNKGTGVKIEIENAINLENINWELVDKSEVIQALTYTGVAEMEDKRCKWNITWL